MTTDTELRCPRDRGALIRQADGEYYCLPCGWSGFPPIAAIRAKEDLLESEKRRGTRGPRTGDLQL